LFLSTSFEMWKRVGLLLFLMLGVLTILVSADPVEVHAREIERRQQNGNSSTTNSSPSTTLPPTTSSTPQQITPTPPPTSTTPPPTTPTPTPTVSNTDTTTPTPTNSDTSSTPSSSISFSRSVRTYITDVVTTINGTPTTLAITGSSTSLVPVTVAPDLQSSTNGGLSDSSKKIVIGVVVGVGGAALLAGIAVVLWRHMHRDKDLDPNASNLTYYHDDAAEGYGQQPMEEVVGHNGPGYHAPAVNSASNF